MKRIIVAIPHSHTFFWTQVCVASLLRNPPVACNYKVDVIVVDNSPWSPAIKGVSLLLPNTSLNLWTTPNPKGNKFHASALDHVVEKYEFDYLMALETDVLALKPNWLQWFVDQMRDTDYAVGMWHHEQFINPSCTLYRGDVLRDMNRWCKGNGYVMSGQSPPTLEAVPANELRWGENFSRTAPLDNNIPLTEKLALENIKEWIAGPFAEKRGFAEFTRLKETPSGQLKGGGWWEPGQQLHAWAVQCGYTYTVCPTLTTTRGDNLPLQTLYGASMPDPQRQLEAVELFGNAETAHMWGGTRALDILKHEVTCQFVKANTPMWLAREARFWKHIVPEDVQEKILGLIRKYGWFFTGQGNNVMGGNERDREAAEYVKQCYKHGGVEI